jgi:hypothetical protein
MFILENLSSPEPYQFDLDEHSGIILRLPFEFLQRLVLMDLRPIMPAGLVPAKPYGLRVRRHESRSIEFRSVA